MGKRESATNTVPPVRLHNRIAVLRAERNLSRQALAAALGINYQTVGFIERGDYAPSLELAFQLSDLFGVPIEMIFSRTAFEPLSLLHLRRSGTDQ